jgi:hypothetical protein
VVVHGWTDAAISWPLCRPVEGRGRPGILVEEELARAVRGESALALIHHFGASQRVVWCWRTALGVGRLTVGSKRLLQLNAEAGADAQRGVPRPDVAERMRRAHQQEDIARHIRGRFAGGRPWTPEEDALLGTMPDAELAERLGRSLNSVVVRRNRAGKRKPSKGAPWSPEEVEAVRTLPPAEAAAKTGRSVGAVYQRSVLLGLSRRGTDRPGTALVSLWYRSCLQPPVILRNPLQGLQYVLVSCKVSSAIGFGGLSVSGGLVSQAGRRGFESHRPL